MQVFYEKTRKINIQIGNFHFELPYLHLFRQNNLYISEKNCNFAAQNVTGMIFVESNTKKGINMSKDSFVKYNTDEERAAAIRGMLNLKNEWLDYVSKREAELGLS